MMVFGEAPDRIIQGAAPRPARHPKHPLLFVATLAAPGEYRDGVASLKSTSLSARVV